MISLFKLVGFTFERLMSVYIHFSIRICSVFDHYGYRAPDIHAWNHLTWYSEDRTLQWLQALHAKLNPHHIHGHEFCHREADQSTLAITRAILDRVGATVTTQVAATSTTSSAPGSLTIPTPSELVVSGKDISSEAPIEFVTTDSEDESDGGLQIITEEEVTPPKPSVKPSVPKLILKRKLKKITKAKKEDQGAVKVPKLKKKKQATTAKSSAKTEKMVVRLPHGEHQLPFSQQLQSMAVQQAKPPSTRKASHQTDDSSSGTQDEGDPTRPSSSGGKTA